MHPARPPAILCSSPAANSAPRRLITSTKVYAYLTERLSDQNVGLMLGCCGAPANWAGRTDLFENALADWRENHRRLGSPKVVLACSSCYQVFKTHLPEVDIVSLWDIYAQHGLPAEITVTRQSSITLAFTIPARRATNRTFKTAYVTSCNGWATRSPNWTLSREKTECCSYGGNMWLANRDLAKKVVERRVTESPLDYVTYCAMCRDFFAAQGKRTLHVLDLIYNRTTD